MDRSTKEMPKKQIKSQCLVDDLNDNERLEYRLEWEGYTEMKMKSDGNCQFRALADQIYKTSDVYKRVRQEIVKQLKSRPKDYKGLVYNMEFSEYVKNMSSNSVWGDEVTLKAAADLYGVKIVLITSLKHTTFMEILPKSQKQPGRVIYLSYLAGIHFNSIYPNGVSSSVSDTASIELLQGQGKIEDDVNNTNKKKKKKKKIKKKEENKEKKDEEDAEEDKEEKEEEEEEVKKLHRQFRFTDVMSILEQEDD